MRRHVGQGFGVGRRPLPGPRAEPKSGDVLITSSTESTPSTPKQPKGSVAFGAIGSEPHLRSPDDTKLPSGLNESAPAWKPKLTDYRPDVSRTPNSTSGSPGFSVLRTPYLQLIPPFRQAPAGRALLLPDAPRDGLGGV